MSVMGATFERLSAADVATPGTLRMSCDPGLKPSSASCPAGSIGLPDLFFGVHAFVRCRRRPVAVDLSATVKASLGNGSSAIGEPR